MSASPNWAGHIPREGTSRAFLPALEFISRTRAVLVWEGCIPTRHSLGARPPPPSLHRTFLVFKQRVPHHEKPLYLGQTRTVDHPTLISWQTLPVVPTYGGARPEPKKIRKSLRGHPTYLPPPQLIFTSLCLNASSSWELTTPRGSFFVMEHL